MILTSLETPFGAPVYYKDITSSTMEDAFFLWTQGASPGTAVIAGTQTAGRGRFSDRTWTAAPQSSLMFTQIFPQSDPRWSGGSLGFLWALALVRILEEAQIPGAIKWPNDVLVNSKKLCGILVQGRKGAYLCGLGINLHQKHFDFSSKVPPTSLGLEGLTLTWEELFVRLQKSFYQELHRQEPLDQRLNQRLYRLNQTVTLNPGLDQAPVQGILLGLGSQGEAILQTTEGIKTLVSGEWAEA